MNKDTLRKLPLRTELFHKVARNADGSPVRCRVNGQLREWKRDPERFILPVKFGLRTCFYITPQNIEEWTLQEEDAK